MNRCRPYRLMNPLTGIWTAYGNAIGYRYASPDGDEGRNNQHLGAHHVSATMLPQLGDNTHILFTATPPRCDGSTTILHSPFFILNWSHTFSAKERDPETGLSYFGSRYYSSDLSIWLSVDPMSDKYPSFSPYVYCANNPVKLVDPNGKEVDDNFDKWKYNKTTGQLDWISNEGGRSHQIVVETQNTPLGEKVYRTVEFDGTISRLFDFSLVSKTVDGIIGGALDMYGGATTVMAGLIIATGGSVISGGAALPVGSVIFSAGAYQTTTGLMQITNAIAGRGADMY